MLALALLVAASPTTYAVVEFGGPAVGRALAAEVSEAIRARPDSLVLGADQLVERLASENRGDLAGCRDRSCYAELAGTVGADELVTGQVDRERDLWTLTLLRLEANSLESLGETRLQWGGSEDELVTLVAPAVDRLFANDPERLLGQIDVGAPAGSVVFVDGARRAEGPGVVDVPVGGVEVRIEPPAGAAVTRWVVVRRSALTRVDFGVDGASPAPKGRPLVSKWWFWTLIGVGVMVATTAVVVATAEDSDFDGDFGSQPGVVLRF